MIHQIFLPYPHREFCLLELLHRQFQYQTFPSSINRTVYYDRLFPSPMYLFFLECLLNIIHCNELLNNFVSSLQIIIIIASSSRLSSQYYCCTHFLANSRIDNRVIPDKMVPSSSGVAISSSYVSIIMCLLLCMFIVITIIYSYLHLH